MRRGIGACVALVVGLAGCTSTPMPQPMDAQAPADVQPPTVVAVRLTPETLSLSVSCCPEGLDESAPLMASAVLSDGTTRALASGELIWASSGLGVASGDDAGVVHGIKPGSVDIAASLRADPRIVGWANVVATASNDSCARLQITPATASISPGGSQAYTALLFRGCDRAEDVTSRVQWRVSNSTSATISSDGVVTWTRPSPANPCPLGTTEVRASLGAVVSNTATLSVNGRCVLSIAITPAATEVFADGGSTCAPANSERFTAIATYNDLSTRNITQEADWTSSDPSVVSVSDTVGTRGSVRAASSATGSASITASLYVVTSSAATVNVTARDCATRIEVTPRDPTLATNATLDLAASAHRPSGTTDVTTAAMWTSSDPAVATVGASDGRVRGVAAGTARITASYTNAGATEALTDTVVVTVTP